MKLFLLSLKLCVLLLLNQSFVFAEDSYNKSQFFEIVQKNINLVVSEVFKNDTLNIISPTCKEAFFNSYMNEKEGEFFYYKLLRDSSKNKNDVGSYYDCIINKYYNSLDKSIMMDFTYLMIYIKKEGGIEKTDIRYEEGVFMFGVCTIDYCQGDEYKELIYRMNENFGNFLDISSQDDLVVFNVKKGVGEISDAELSTVLICLIPFYLFVIQLLFMWYPKIPFHLFKCCFIKKIGELDMVDYPNVYDSLGPILEPKDDKFYKNLNEKDDEEINPLEVSEIMNTSSDKNIFQLQTQIPTVLAATGSDPINLGMEENKLTSRGNILSKIFTSTKSQTSLLKDRKFLNKTLLFKFKQAFSIINNGEELFLSKSTQFNNDGGLTYIRGIRGISLFLVIYGLCFYILYNSPIKIYEKTSFTNFLKSPLFFFVFFGLRYAPKIIFSCSGFIFIYKFLCYLDDRSNENEREDDGTKSEISYKHLCAFLSKQFYKYIIFIWVVCFFMYSLLYIVDDFSQVGPMWVFFKKNVIDQLDWKYLIGHVFLYDNFRYDVNSRLNFFWMPINEFLFFLFSSFVVFISYKKNYRMDLFFLFVFVILLVLRLGFFEYMKLVSQPLYSTLFYYFDGYGNMFISPLYNYPFFIIGILFGQINYIIQKGIRRRELTSLRKNYLSLAMFLTKAFRDNSKKAYVFFVTIGFIFLCFFSLSYPIILFFYETDNYYTDFFTNSEMNIFLLFDTDVVVIIVNIIPLFLFFMGENYIIKFLSSSFWMILSRISFTYTLLVNPFILYIFYRSESRIKLDYFNIMFFSTVNFVVMLIVSCFIYIFFELPSKRITKIILREDKEQTI